MQSFSSIQMTVMMGLLLILSSRCCLGRLYEMEPGSWPSRERLCYWSEQQQRDQNLDTFDNNGDPYIYVLLPNTPNDIDEPDYRLILHKSKDSTSHSCLSAGQPVAAAGTVRMVGNKMVWDNVSGHYKPGPTSLNTLANFLRKFLKARQENYDDCNEFRTWIREDCSAEFREMCTQYFYQLTSEQQLNQAKSLGMLQDWTQTMAMQLNTYTPEITIQDSRIIILHKIPSSSSIQVSSHSSSF